MSNLQVIKAFLEGKEGETPLRKVDGWKNKGRTLYTRYNYLTKELELINYETVIASIKGNTVKLNKNKYSATTSKIQSQLYYNAERNGLVIETL